MKIRTKLLILLLVFSLLPVLTLRIMGRQSMQSLGRELSVRAGAALLERASVELKRIVEDHALMLKLRVELLEVALSVQAREMERLSMEQGGDAEVLFISRPGSKASLPSQTGSPIKYLIRQGNTSEPLSINENMLSVFPAPQLSQSQVRSSLERYSTLPDFFKALEGTAKNLPVWRYMKLSGLAGLVYPAFGSVNRRMVGVLHSNVFINEEREVRWRPPYPDPILGQPVVAVETLLRNPQGRIVGSTGIVVLADDLLTLNKEHQSMYEAKSFVVRPLGTGEKGFEVLLQENDHQETGSRMPMRMMRQIPEQPKRILLKDEKLLQKISADIDAGKSGIALYPYEGKNSLWAYASGGELGTTLLYIAPMDVVSSDAKTAVQGVERLFQEQVRHTMAVLFFVAAFVILAASLAAQTVNRRIAEMVGAVERIASGDFSARVKRSSGDEFGRLAGAVNTMAPDLAERMRLKSSLELAMEVQQSLLPQKAPKIPGLDIAALSIYCDETGGDYFDYLLEKEGRLGMVVGDVCGHGASAALLMASIRAYMRAEFINEASPAVLMAGVNTLTTSDTYGTGRFATLFFLCVDSSTSQISWAVAGHDSALLYDPRTKTFKELSGQGLPVGVEASTEYAEGHMPWPKGCTLVVDTDGIAETRNAEGEMFGRKRLREVLRHAEGKTAEEIIAHVFQEVDRFRGHDHLEDDMTLLVAVFED